MDFNLSALNFGLDYLGAPGVSQGDPSFAGKLNLPVSVLLTFFFELKAH